MLVGWIRFLIVLYCFLPDSKRGIFSEASKLQRRTLGVELILTWRSTKCVLASVRSVGFYAARPTSPLSSGLLLKIGVALAPLEGEQNSSTTVMVATSVGTLPNYKILMVFILVFHKNCWIRSWLGGLWRLKILRFLLKLVHTLLNVMQVLVQLRLKDIRIRIFGISLLICVGIYLCFLNMYINIHIY